MDAVRAEALNESVTVVWRDQKFTIAPLDDWVLEASHYQERGKLTLCLEAMLGSEQYNRFLFKTVPKPKASEMNQLVESINSAFGITAGESAASTS